MVGTVTKIDYNRGFGFVRSEIGDVFFHAKDIEDNVIEDLKINSVVTYVLLYGEKGFYAKSIYKQK